MHDEIKILDIEKKTKSFEVIFEVPGHHYNQDYPKRLKHSFNMQPKLLEKDENEDFIFEQHLRKHYLKTEKDKNKEEQVQRRIENSKKEVQGKKIE